MARDDANENEPVVQSQLPEASHRIHPKLPVVFNRIMVPRFTRDITPLDPNGKPFSFVYLYTQDPDHE